MEAKNICFVNIYVCRHEKLSCIVWTPTRYVTPHFRDRRGAASLRYRNRAEITFIMSEQNGFRAGTKVIRYERERKKVVSS